MFITKEELKALYIELGSFSKIAERYGKSRERIRVLAKQHGVKPVCVGCGRRIKTFRSKFCQSCSRERKRKRYREWLSVNRPEKDFSRRPAIADAVDFYNEQGLEVDLNRRDRYGLPELAIGEKQLKVYQMTPLSKGHQMTLRPVDAADYYHLTDMNGTLYIIPASEVNEMVTYIGLRSPLRRFGSEEWLKQAVEELHVLS